MQEAMRSEGRAFIRHAVQKRLGDSSCTKAVDQCVRHAEEIAYVNSKRKKDVYWALLQNRVLVIESLSEDIFRHAFEAFDKPLTEPTRIFWKQKMLEAVEYINTDSSSDCRAAKQSIVDEIEKQHAVNYSQSQTQYEYAMLRQIEAWREVSLEEKEEEKQDTNFVSQCKNEVLLWMKQKA
jgi:hypothetical protein